MSENLQALLEKINEEGVKSGEEKGRAIETKARESAERIINDAKIKAEKIMEDAKKESDKLKSSAETAIKHAARDLMLSLKQEIKALFAKAVSLEINNALTSEQIAAILADLIKSYIEKGGNINDVSVLIKKDDLDKLKDTFISKLQEKLKARLEFKTASNINSGFYITFDKGKSSFDFSEEGLLEALSAYLNPELEKILKA